MPTFYDHHHVTHWFDRHTLAKGRAYVGAVSHVQWQGVTLRGRVQGRERKPYTTTARITHQGASLQLRNQCSCFLGGDCKHVVALLLAGLVLAPAPPPAGYVRPELLDWLSQFRTRHAQRQRPAAAIGAKKQQHVLVYVLHCMNGGPAIMTYKARHLADGSIGTLGKPWHPSDRSVLDPPGFIASNDLPILVQLNQLRMRDADATPGLDLGRLLGDIIGTGRALTWHPEDSTPRLLRLGPSRDGRLLWLCTADGRLAPSLEVHPPAVPLLSAKTFWYLDALGGEAGPLVLALPAHEIADFLDMPALLPGEVALASEVLQHMDSALPTPPAQGSEPSQVIDTPPVPVLTLDSPALPPAWGRASRSPPRCDRATLHLDYAGTRITANSTRLFVAGSEGQPALLKRDYALELDYQQQLRDAGLQPVVEHYPEDAEAALPMELRAGGDWPTFMRDTVPMLRAQGWQIAISEDFQHNTIQVEGIQGSLQATDNGWFDVAMDIMVNERKVALAPLLTDLFARDRRWLHGPLEAIADDEQVMLTTDRNERLLLGADRLKPVVALLADLLDGGGERQLRIAAHDAGRLQALQQNARWQFHGEGAAAELARRLIAGPGVTAVVPPHGLQANLRDYQLRGLEWMQFLRANDLSGVLADDMGLGKTLQALAHVLVEKQAGRLDRPALVVLPTTLMHNWQTEAARFTPALKVLALHGPQRQQHFAQIAQHDLVLTTYPLLCRDLPTLSAQPYHLLILDEAQYVKKATTQAAQALRKLDSRHRLCLTGTPLENHLGELWAQFDFLLPGLLGSEKTFNRHWRNPIEKSADQTRNTLLAGRLRPFILRRSKQQVATELPPKTVITRAVTLEGPQRDLYETVRTAMQKKVRAAIAQKGMAGSHIIVLDALLKLRQVCCDPRLLPSKVAAKSRASAKLALLMDMLPELIEEGRRILLFSQFTGMLKLIAEALDKAGIAYVTLTGQTRDRTTPVQRFMDRQVPLFLISLKAGGVGLNLTAADTVIHYDPWWNPAAENQASDRAHRIGQDKAVFVYKLITAGSIEEKIVALQERKAALADAILSDDAATASKFSAEDLDGLFAPLPAQPAHPTPGQPGPGRPRAKRG